MKLIKSVLLATLLFSGSAFAQSNEPVISSELRSSYVGVSSEDVAQAQTNHMNEYLHLSESQYNQVYELNLKVADKIHTIMEYTDWTEERRQQFIEGNLKDRRNAMSQVLTAEQFTLFDQEEYQ